VVEPESFVAEAVESVRETVGDGHAVIALSGGVDSSTAAAIAGRALGDRLTPVYVDTGLMRAGETDRIRGAFPDLDVRVVDAGERFLSALSGVTDPEEKRHVVGERFVREFETVAREAEADYLVQGTIYPDRIESEGSIKSHHNVGGLPEAVDFEGIVEPLRELYKDEVRELARHLDLAASERMPFPGPGLAVRVVGEVTAEKVRVVRRATAIVEEELADADPWQAFAALLGRATGVKGDNRVHGWVVAVRSVESRDGMTARAQRLDWDRLQRLQSRITGEIDEVSRVVYDVTHKPPATIEYE
jgi:GMP synthase (glutamine-hydrolysing)